MVVGRGLRTCEQSWHKALREQEVTYAICCVSRDLSLPMFPLSTRTNDTGPKSQVVTFSSELVDRWVHEAPTRRQIQ